MAISEYLVWGLQDSSNWTVGSDGVDIGKIYQSKVSKSTTADIINLGLILSETLKNTPNLVNVVSADGIVNCITELDVHSCVVYPVFNNPVVSRFVCFCGTRLDARYNRVFH